MPALQSIGFNPTRADIKRLIAAADEDGDGMIEYDSQEFITLLDELEDEPYDQVLAAFEYLDKDGDGLISAEELRDLVMNHGEKMTQVWWLDDSLWSLDNTDVQEEADDLVKKADLNGDGSIDYFEFVQMYNIQSTNLHW